MRQIYKNGRFFWVNDDGSPSNMNTPLNPGIGVRRERDIYSRLPDAELAGFEGPGAVPFGMAQSRQDASGRPEPVPTYRPLAGNQENNRGNNVVFDPATIPYPAPSVTGVGAWKLIAQNEKNSGEDAECICVSLGRYVVNAVRGSGGDAGVMLSQYQCLVEWGIGGANFSCILDWDHGRTFSIPASFIRVSGRHLILNADGGSPILPSTEALSVGFGYGIEGHRNSPRLTFPIGPRDGANDGTIPGGPVLPGGITNLADNIPEFATHIGLYVSDSPFTGVNLPVQVTFYKQGAGIQVTNTVYQSLSNVQSENLLPIPNGTSLVQVTNLSPVPVYIDGFWGLSL